MATVYRAGRGLAATFCALLRNECTNEWNLRVLEGIARISRVALSKATPDFLWRRWFIGEIHGSKPMVSPVRIFGF